MDRLIQRLEEKRQRISRLAQRWAFERYLRYGRAQEPEVQAAIGLTSESKAVGGVVSVGALPAQRATSHYVWRTAGDERVRSSHAALAGRVFSWANPPAHGHPGSEPNCRCWPERYYGDPKVPDSALTMQRAVRVDVADIEPWTRIETLTRPDGSVAQSFIVGRDGARIFSLFSGTSVAHAVTLPDGQVVRLEHPMVFRPAISAAIAARRSCEASGRRRGRR